MSRASRFATVRRGDARVRPLDANGDRRQRAAAARAPETKSTGALALCASRHRMRAVQTKAPRSEPVWSLMHVGRGAPTPLRG
jgi:hypothetical protein